MVSTIKQQVSHCCVIAALLLPHILFAEVLVVTGANSPAITMNINQVRDIFLGKVVSLPDGSFPVLIDLSETNSLREEFYMKIANRSAAQAKAHWAKLYFTGRGVPPHECANEDEVKRMLQATPGAIGYIDRDSLDSSVKVVVVVQ